MWRVERPKACRRRFGAHLSALANFVSTLIWPRRVRTGGSRERPKQFAALPSGVNGSEPAVNASLWVIPGSRLLRHFLVGLALRRIREVALARAKAAPLQTLGAPTPSYQHPFENEDEDDWA